MLPIEEYWRAAGVNCMVNITTDKCLLLLKGARFYFSKFSFLIYLKDHHTKDVNLKFQLNRSSRLDVGSKL